MATTTEAEQTDVLPAVYAETSATMRHYSNLQFAIQTLYLAGAGALGSAAFLSERAQRRVGPLALGAWACVAALLLSVVFFVQTRSCERHRKHFSRQTCKLERTLVGTVFSEVPPSRLIGASVMLNIFYLLNIAFWSFAICKMR